MLMNVVGCWSRISPCRWEIICCSRNERRLWALMLQLIPLVHSMSTNDSWGRDDSSVVAIVGR